MILLYDEGVFYGVSQVGGVTAVSKVQLYVNLFNYPAREEAAEMILRALEKQWVSQKGGKQSLRLFRLTLNSFAINETILMRLKNRYARLPETQRRLRN